MPDFVGALPPESVEEFKRSLEMTGKKVVTLAEVVAALKKWKRRQNSELTSMAEREAKIATAKWAARIKEELKEPIKEPITLQQLVELVPPKSYSMTESVTA